MDILVETVTRNAPFHIMDLNVFRNAIVLTKTVIMSMAVDILQ